MNKVAAFGLGGRRLIVGGTGGFEEGSALLDPSTISISPAPFRRAGGGRIGPSCSSASRSLLSKEDAGKSTTTGDPLALA
jgi:hypothetical protein